MNVSLEAIYASLPSIQCKRLCQECCGPVSQSPAEAAAMQQANGGKLPGQKPALTCGLLVAGGCKIYAARPLVCRLYGVVKEMQCPHGCVPEWWVTDEQARHLFARAERLQ